jgi:tetratricopeptide (TPR) repeat protein
MTIPGRVVILTGVAALVGGGVWLLAVRDREAPASPPQVSIGDTALAGTVATAREAVIAKPDDASRWGRLGQLYLANGFSDPARDCFIEAAKLQRDEPRWPYLEGVSLLLRDPPAALSCWQRAADCPGRTPATVTARLRWAESLLQNNRTDEAEAAYRRALKDDPQSVRAQFGLGLIAQSRGDFTTAIADFERCLEHPSARQKSAAALAAIYTRKNETAQAEEFARKADALPPDQSWPDPILEELVPLTIGQQSLLIQAEQQAQQGNTRQAALILERLIQEYPHEGRAYVKLGMIFAERGEFAQAESVLRAGLGESADLVQARYFLTVSLYHQAERLGFTGEGRRKLEEALAESERAIALKPDHGYAHLYRGLALRRLGRAQDGLAELREAVRCTPDAADVHLHLGEALQEDGNSPEAVKELEAAAHLSRPDDQRATRALDRIRKVNKR